MDARAGGDEPHQFDVPASGLLTRLLSRRAGGMLVRNTVVGTSVFLVGLALLWVLVEWARMDEVLAAAIGFLVANSMHYVLGRTWIFRGTTRPVHTGYALFLLNAGVGLAITVGLFAAFLHFTPINYLAARVIVSVFAGLAMFVLNAVFTFRQF
jgi:putative flippase GtrA